MLFSKTTLSLAVALTLASPFSHADEIAPEAKQETGKYAIALHGEPKYAKDFKHLDYANPDAPKGGTLKQHVIGTFDSLNPFIVKGKPAAGLNFLRSGLIYESLMQNSSDEPFSLYGVIAEDITVAADKSWVKFNLREEARWHDGKTITSEDVIWSFNALTQKGQPFYKAYWNDVESITSKTIKSVTFHFSTKGNAELPLIIAEMPILPKHYWDKEENNFEETSLTAPLGSGPYKMGKVVVGRSIEYIRADDWWGKELTFFKGMNNFDKIIFDYYRDDSVAHEAFLSQDYDIKIENIAKSWKEKYKLSDKKQPHLNKEEIEHNRPAGMQAFIYNIRKPLFQDIKLREALNYAYDFEWSNKQFAYGDYIRTNSYFDNSELASFGLPSPEELVILNPLRGEIPDEVFTKTYKAPVTDGTGKVRNNLKTAVKLLEQAGYKELNADGYRYKTLNNGKIQILQFEILHYSPTYERWVLPFIKNLKRIGVKANFRAVDPAQFQSRAETFDYDMIIGGMGQSASPGNEQRDYWGSDKADMNGSRNYIGIKDTVIDKLIEGIIHAESRADLVTKTRVLDRILLWNHYIIPMWHHPKWRIAYWDSISHPKNLSGSSPNIAQTWWATEVSK